MTVAPAPSEHRRITRGAILKRLLAVAVAGLALYGLAPKLGEVLGGWPRLRDIEPGWFAVIAVTESASLICMRAVQRIARGSVAGEAFLAGLVGNAVSELLPGGAATSAALQFGCCRGRGSRPPARRPASPPPRQSCSARCCSSTFWRCRWWCWAWPCPPKLLAAAWVSTVLLLGIVLIGYFALVGGDRFLTAVDRGH